MSDVFIEKLGLPTPKYNLQINNLSHGEMTARMLAEIEKIIFVERPHFVLVYGDTSSTLAGALAASKTKVMKLRTLRRVCVQIICPCLKN